MPSLADIDRLRLLNRHLIGEPRARNSSDAQPAIAAFIVVHAVESVIEAAFRKRPDELRSERFSAELTRLALEYLAPWDDAKRSVHRVRANRSTRAGPRPPKR